MGPYILGCHKEKIAALATIYKAAKERLGPSKPTFCTLVQMMKQPSYRDQGTMQHGMKYGGFVE